MYTNDQSTLSGWWQLLLRLEKDVITLVNFISFICMNYKVTKILEKLRKEYIYLGLN